MADHGSQTLYVISDLHLGGASDYAICRADGQALLENFLATLTTEVKAGKNVHLVINGDSVDFLAEREFQAFTRRDKDATAKLDSIIKGTRGVWNQFAAFVAAGGELTFTIGNHDIELTLPGPRQLLEKTLGQGRVTLLLGGEPLRLGDVLIKHGNQYDRWNYVDHEALKRFRESKREEAFTPPPGSRLVNEVMNPVKQKYSFVNLLKPENQGAIPFLVLLNPRQLGYIVDLVPRAVDAQRVKVDTEAVHGGLVSDRHPDDQAELDFAKEIGFGDGNHAEVAGFGDLITSWKTAALRKVLDRYLANHLLTFDTGNEQDDYLKPATKAAADHGVKVILYGHTHLAKRIPVGNEGAVYINTGTWADLLCVPDSILLPDNETEGNRQLEQFAKDLRTNQLAAWVRPVPTYARIEMEGGVTRNAQARIWKGEGQSEELPSGRLSRLFVKAAQESAKGQGN